MIIIVFKNPACLLVPYIILYPLYHCYFALGEIDGACIFFYYKPMFLYIYVTLFFLFYLTIIRFYCMTMFICEAL